MKEKLFVTSVVVLLFVVTGLSALSSTASLGQPVTIKVAHFYTQISDPEDYAWIQGVFKDFERDHPNIKIKEEIYDWDKIDTRAMMDLRTGIRHDVMWSTPQLMPKHMLVEDYISLEPYVDKWSDEERADFDWSPVWDKCYPLGIPTGMHTRVLIYRRDMFEEVGLDPDRPPQNLDELVEYAKKLTCDTDGDGRTDVWGLGMYFGPSRATVELFFAPYLWHYGGQLWDPETKKAVFASEAGVQAAQFLYDLVYKYKVTPRWCAAGTYDDVVRNKFLAGNYAMVMGWGNYWTAYLETEGWISDCFPPTQECKPQVVDIAVYPTKNHEIFANAWSLSIHKLSIHPDESFEFIEYVLKPDNLIDFPDAGLPARESLWERPEYSTDFYKTWHEAAKQGRPMQSTAHYNELGDAVAAAIQEILAQKAPVQATLQKYQDEYNAVYAGE
jgi:ABC-type glycerol-3-phosphate transport system substrate-binding protein